MSIEAFTCLLVFKNIFSFGLTFKGFDWLVEAGDTRHMFIALGSVQVAVCALTIPMCEFPHPPSFSHFPPFSLLRDSKHDGVMLRCCDAMVVNTNPPPDIFGKRNRSFFHRHNIFFRATDWLANGVLRLLARGSEALG